MKSKVSFFHYFLTRVTASAFAFALTLAIAGALLSKTATGAENLNALKFEQEQDSFGARLGHWQPGQFMVTFFLPNGTPSTGVPGFVYGIGNIQTNVTPGKINVWINSCQVYYNDVCELVNIVWLDNPGKAECAEYGGANIYSTQNRSGGGPTPQCVGKGC